MVKHNPEDEFSYDERQNMPYARITPDGEERRSYHPSEVWELELAKLLEAVAPLDYFRTTGEAIHKIRKLEKDLFVAAGRARKLGNVLQKLKGENIYLETCWTDGRLLLKAKNPRKNREAKLQALQENFAFGDKTKAPTESVEVADGVFEES